MQNIIDTRKYRKELGKKASGFQNGTNETQQGITIENAMLSMIGCLVKNNSFSRLNNNNINNILRKIEEKTFEGINPQNINYKSFDWLKNKIEKSESFTRKESEYWINKCIGNNSNTFAFLIFFIRTSNKYLSSLLTSFEIESLLLLVDKLKEKE